MVKISLHYAKVDSLWIHPEAMSLSHQYKPTRPIFLVNFSNFSKFLLLKDGLFQVLIWNDVYINYFSTSDHRDTGIWKIRENVSTEENLQATWPAEKL